MNTKLAIAGLVLVALASCKKDTTTEVNLVSSGKIEKGPFMKGSNVEFYELSNSLVQTGRQFSSIIKSDLGEFDITGQLTSGNYLVAQATGYFYNETTYQLSDAQITLNGLCDPTRNVNINLFTHLEKPRVEYLVSQGKAFSEAKKQALKELFAVFSISSTIEYAEDATLVGDKSNGELLAISSIFLQGLSSTDYIQNITTFAQDLKDGKIDDSSMLTTLSKNALALDTAQVKSKLSTYLASKGLSKTIPNVSRHLESIADYTINAINSSYSANFVIFSSDYGIDTHIDTTPGRLKDGVFYFNKQGFETVFLPDGTINQQVVPVVDLSGGPTLDGIVFESKFDGDGAWFTWFKEAILMVDGTIIPINVHLDIRLITDYPVVVLSGSGTNITLANGYGNLINKGKTYNNYTNEVYTLKFYKHQYQTVPSKTMQIILN